jgi:hypothetical protein
MRTRSCHKAQRTAHTLWGLQQPSLLSQPGTATRSCSVPPWVDTLLPCTSVEHLLLALVVWCVYARCCGAPTATLSFCLRDATREHAHCCHNTKPNVLPPPPLSLSHLSISAPLCVAAYAHITSCRAVALHGTSPGTNGANGSKRFTAQPGCPLSPSPMWGTTLTMVLTTMCGVVGRNYTILSCHLGSLQGHGRSTPLVFADVSSFHLRGAWLEEHRVCAPIVITSVRLSIHRRHERTSVNISASRAYVCQYIVITSVRLSIHRHHERTSVNTSSSTASFNSLLIFIHFSYLGVCSDTHRHEACSGTNHQLCHCTDDITQYTKAC